MNAKQKSVLAKIFAIAGTALLWAPVLFMFVTAVRLHHEQKISATTLPCGAFPLVAIGMVCSSSQADFARFAKWFGWGSAAASRALAGG
jgi:hypothetical protein